MLPHYLAKFRSRICGNFKKQCKNCVTLVARSVRLLPAHMIEDVHATRQLHCQGWCGQCHTKHAENAALFHSTCLYKIVCYLQRIFNRNRKLKQHVSK